MNTHEQAHARALEAFILGAFPHDEDARTLCVEAFDDQSLTVRLRYHARQLRPGASIAGPALMKLADTAVYLCLVHLDTDQASSVTSSLHIDFLRRPSASDLLAKASILKLGRVLSTVSVAIMDTQHNKLVANVTATYARNPEVRIPDEMLSLLEHISSSRA